MVVRITRIRIAIALLAGAVLLRWALAGAAPAPRRVAAAPPVATAAVPVTPPPAAPRRADPARPDPPAAAPPLDDATVARMVAAAAAAIRPTHARPPRPDPLPPPGLERQIRAAAARTHVPADLIRAVIMAESGGDPHAVSRTGAMGLMQLEPLTASGLGVDDAFNIRENVTGGARYLASLLQSYRRRHAACAARAIPSDSGVGPCPSPLVEALAAYNAGPQAVARYGGLPPYPETQRYVAQVLANYAAYSGR